MAKTPNTNHNTSKVTECLAFGVHRLRIALPPSPEVRDGNICDHAGLRDAVARCYAEAKRRPPKPTFHQGSAIYRLPHPGSSRCVVAKAPVFSVVNRRFSHSAVVATAHARGALAVVGAELAHVLCDARTKAIPTSVSSCQPVNLNSQIRYRRHAPRR